MKKKLFASALLIVILCACVQGTVAYFSGNAVAHNVITSGAIDIELVETKKDTPTSPETPYPTDPVEGIMPNKDVSKIVRVKNTGEFEAYVRVKVAKSVVSQGNKKLDESKLTISFDNGAYWTEKDGFYYYNQVLAPGASTEPLFTQVHFDATAGNDYQNARIEIDVQAQGTQVANNPIPAAGITAVKGWPLF